jgi:subtilase family serine protease
VRRRSVAILIGLLAGGALAAATFLAGLFATGTATRGAAATAARSGALGRAATSPSGRAHRLGPLSNGTVGFALNLRLRQGQLNAYLAHVTPQGPSGNGLSAAQFGQRFGPSDADMARLRTLLSQLGITVTQTYPQRTAMLVRAPVSRVDKLFGLRFGRYVTADGKRYFAPERRPRIPASLAPYITSLGDLSDVPIPADDIPTSGLTPAVVAKAYDIKPLWKRGDEGQGETIAIASLFGAVNTDDITQFAKHEGIASPDIQFRKVDGGSTFSSQQGSDGEVDLDLQVVLGIVPKARIIDYQGSDGSTTKQTSLGHSLADIYNAIEQDGQAKIVTTSYGECEALLQNQNPGDQQLIDNSLKALEAANVTVFIATGDTGAYACLQAAQIEPASTLPSGFVQLAIQTPSSSPFAVAVGGTRLDLRSDGSYLAESAWADSLSRSGGGGGISESEPRPTWQKGPGVIEKGLNPHGRRQTPDVAGPADPNSGFFICQTVPGIKSPLCEAGNGGTSAAAPFWAASMLLVQQFAAHNGAGSLDHCFAGPILYDLASTKQPVPPFHPVLFGNNGFYPAHTGWNYATGLGSPDVFNLAQDYAAFLRNRSSKTCPF